MKCKWCSKIYQNIYLKYYFILLKHHAHVNTIQRLDENFKRTHHPWETRDRTGDEHTYKFTYSSQNHTEVLSLRRCDLADWSVRGKHSSCASIELPIRPPGLFLLLGFVLGPSFLHDNLWSMVGPPGLFWLFLGCSWLYITQSEWKFHSGFRGKINTLIQAKCTLTCNGCNLPQFRMMASQM